MVVWIRFLFCENIGVWGVWIILVNFVLLCVWEIVCFGIIGLSWNF